MIVPPAITGSASATAAAATDAGIGDALSKLTGALQLPVLLIAIAMLLLTAIETGRFVTELLRRSAASRRRPLRSTAALAITAEDPARAAELARQAPTAASAVAVAALASTPVDAEHALTDYEHAVQRRLDRTRLLVRSGPALGLMGTLIPLAPGLTALGRGDVPSLADDLRRAFAATIIGILVGTVSYAITLTRSRLYSEDLTQLERAATDAQQTLEPVT
ncbi:MAG: MotA/TolQ/ExbB proton channel family protein [Solirubrobacteraceae bacterium]|nr:MotA/TolQ/ExbB proton channel family protein [Patulibacter sp.]